jgi:hypothetical protein
MNPARTNTRRAIASIFAFAAVGAALTLTGCASANPDDAEGDGEATSEDPLRQTANNAWFYGGALPTLDNPEVTISLVGHTARVSGLVPTNVALGALPPHAKTRLEGTRTRLDAVFPIATARASKTSAPVGTYRFNDVIPYRPDGTAVTAEEGEHQVTWGGFPFLRYNGGFAMHGPITFVDNKAPADALSVWYLQRGPVSGGCNRMMGEHVVEVAHVTGISMRKVYARDRHVNPPKTVKVNLIATYDTYGDKYIDVDYPTTGAMKRPGTVFGNEKVEMFGSWVATEMPNGRDLPADFKWEGGVSGKPYVFASHAQQSWVCSVAPEHLARLSAFATSRGGEVPPEFCAKKDCVLKALVDKKDVRAACSL